MAKPGSGRVWAKRTGSTMACAIIMRNELRDECGLKFYGLRVFGILESTEFCAHIAQLQSMRGDNVCAASAPSVRPIDLRRAEVAPRPKKATYALAAP